MSRDTWIPEVPNLAGEASENAEREGLTAEPRSECRGGEVNSHFCRGWIGAQRKLPVFRQGAISLLSGSGGRNQCGGLRRGSCGGAKPVYLTGGLTSFEKFPHAALGGHVINGVLLHKDVLPSASQRGLARCT